MKDPESTLELLTHLLGKRTAKRVFRGSLVDLFLDDTLPDDVKARLRASRELVQRWMLEDMRRQPVLQNPEPFVTTSPCTTPARSARSLAACSWTTATGSSRWRRCSWAPSTAPRCIHARS